MSVKNEMEENRSEQKIWSLTEDKATLILRWYLPREPYCTPEVTGERLEELVSLCKTCGITAVQLLVGMNPDWIYLPCSPEYAEEWAQDLKVAAQRLRKEGISYQLNIVNVMGHYAGGVDFRQDYDWETVVDHEGNVGYGTGCPLGEKFRKKTSRFLRAFASTMPDAMWIDDDVRYHNHDRFHSGGRDWYCFCEKHLQRFAKAYGTYLTREELIGKILEPGEPSPERILWRKVQGDTMNEFCRWMAQEIHQVSPHTRIAKMSSTPEVHSTEGTEWKGLFEALSDGLRPLARPTFGPYIEGNPQDFIESVLVADRMRADMEEAVGEGNIDMCPEIEFAAYTTWSRSGKTLSYQLETSQYLGMRGTTMVIYDWEGSPIAEEPRYEQVMKEVHPRLDAIAALGLEKAHRHGIALLTGEDICEKVQLKDGAKKLDSLMGDRTWDRTLSLLGAPCVYTTSRTAEGYSVIALDGLTAWYPTDEELKVLLSKGVLLDANACDVLIRRGFGSYIGVESIAYVKWVQTSSEFFYDGILEGMDERRMNQRLHDHGTSVPWGRMTIGDGTKVLTEVNDPRGHKYPGTVLFENELGGRVAVYAGRCNLTNYFRCHARVDWLNALTRWLSRDSFISELKTVQATACVIRECERGLLIACANLGTDPVDSISGVLRPGFAVRGVKVLGKNGFGELAEGELEIFSDEAGTVVYTYHPRESSNTYDYMTLLFEREK